ncbi:hypothetical protein OIU77_018519 [Salix suchowensis]|uniref:Uncharacterized protein n=1 Tax=Salix suchowensis TaxID=1278906 RepID=A0ABQ9CCX1_9ROSI|nr:hypothetical protein OIU77_018519 [Salix suchowensis]
MENWCPWKWKNTQRINASNKCYPSQPDNINADILSTDADGNPAEEEPGMNPRRQSTRNRPMTIKALAALEYGFSEVKKKPKSTGARTHKKSCFRVLPRVPQQSTGNMNACSVGAGIVDLKEESDASGAFIS